MLDANNKSTDQPVFTQSGQYLCYSLSGKYCSTIAHQNFNILANFCSRAGWFEPYLIRNLVDRFSGNEMGESFQDYS